MAIYISAVDRNYAYDPVPPLINIGISIPSSKLHPSLISVPVTVTDNFSINTSGIQLGTTSAATIENLVQVSDDKITFNVQITGVGTNGFEITATDYLGNVSSASDTGYTIDPEVELDEIPPLITFSQHDPEDRFVLSRGSLVDSVSGTKYENTGSVLCTIKDYNGSITPSLSNVKLVDGSVGFIDEESLKQVETPTTISFNIWNISATGNVVVSAQDDFGNGATATDGKWVIGCGNNDRFIDLVQFLPSYLQTQTLKEFVQFFENFLNTVYSNESDQCNISILKKIERLGTLHDPSEIDIEYLEFFASMMGYGVDLNTGDLGLFVVGNEDPVDSDEIADRNRALRFVVQNLPNWYRIKTTRNAIKIMLYSFGIVGDILYNYTNDYNKNWINYDGDPSVNITSFMPRNYYPTPHFSLNVDIGSTTPKWVDRIEDIIRAINSIKPINTVFDNITASIKLPCDTIETDVRMKNTLVYHISHSGPTWTI